MHPWIASPTLHEHMMAALRPRVRKRGLNHGATVSTPAPVGVSDDILKEAVTPSTAQQVWCSDEHARRRDAVALIRYKDVDARLRQGLLPNAFGAFERLGSGAHLRRGEQRWKRRQIGILRRAER
jgi:hypothetical protein